MTILLILKLKNQQFSHSDRALAQVSNFLPKFLKETDIKLGVVSLSVCVSLVCAHACTHTHTNTHTVEVGRELGEK